MSKFLFHVAKVLIVKFGTGPHIFQLLNTTLCAVVERFPHHPGVLFQSRVKKFLIGLSRLLLNECSLCTGLVHISC